jgi:DNA-binding MarR family transcriptional regulator
MMWTPGYVRLDDRVAAPHAALQERPAFAIQDLARTVRSCVDQQLEGTRLTWVDFALLLVADRVQRLSQQAVASRARVDRNRASVALAELERRGYLSREQSAADARKLEVTLTVPGRAVLAEARAAVERGERHALRPLDDHERAWFEALLARLVTDETPPFFRR